MLSAQRYVAYTSDIGESFRPIAHPYLVKGAYAISWAYLIGDVSNEGYKAYCRQQRLLAPAPGATPPNATSAIASASAEAEAAPERQRIPTLEDYRTIMAQRAVFQSIASMGLPAFTIHSIVRYSGKALKNAKNTTIRTWGPIGVRPILWLNSSADLPFSSVWRRFLRFHSCLTNRWKKPSSGFSIMRSRLSVEKLLLAHNTPLGGKNPYGSRVKKRGGGKRRRSCRIVV